MQNVDERSIDTNQIGSIRNLYISSLFCIMFPLLGFIIPSFIGFTKSNRNAQYQQNLRFILLLHIIQIILISILYIILEILGYKTESSSRTIYVPEMNAYNHDYCFKRTHIFEVHPVLFIIPALILYKH